MDVGPAIPGWYGKFPPVGDFVGRRLPQKFIDLWHGWLEKGIAASKISLGDRWLDKYLNCPVWHFLLTPGVCGGSFWAGTLMSSVDKVGRYFPLTIAAEIDATIHSLATITARSEWYTALEQFSMTLLDTRTSIEDLESGLTKIPFPAPDAVYVNGARGFFQWWVNADSVSKTFHLARPDGVNELVLSAAWQGIANKAAGRTLWWTSNGQELHCFVGLPPASYFSVLLEYR